MPTERQIAASRANGAKSRGPKTEEGRRKVAFNAIRHGLTARDVVIANESKENFQELLATYLAELEPVGEIEYGFVEQMVAAKWRIRRAWSIEAAIYDLEIDRQAPGVEEEFETITHASRAALAYMEIGKSSGALANLSRHEARLERSYERALNNLRKTQQLRRAEPQPIVEPEPAPATESAPEPESATPAAATETEVPAALERIAKRTQAPRPEARLAHAAAPADRWQEVKTALPAAALRRTAS
jgi:hypothetical protein